MHLQFFLNTKSPKINFTANRLSTFLESNEFYPCEQKRKKCVHRFMIQGKTSLNSAKKNLSNSLHNSITLCSFKKVTGLNTVVANFIIFSIIYGLAKFDNQNIFDRTEYPLPIF